MKQTAVEWLEQHFFLDDSWRRIFEQAKEMEKEQIIEAYNDAIYDHRQDNGEQYYIETFKQD